MPLLDDEFVERVLLALVAALLELLDEGDGDLCLGRPAVRFPPSRFVILKIVISNEFFKLFHRGYSYFAHKLIIATTEESAAQLFTK